MTKLWDCHTDLLSRLLRQPVRSLLPPEPAADPSPADGPHYTLERVQAGGVGVLVCALFTADDRLENPVVRTLRMIDRAHDLERLSDGRLALATTAAAIDDLVAAGRTAMVLSIENGVACLDRIELLHTYYRLGVRAIGLTWNGRNHVADGCLVEATGSRLTPFGRELVAAMNTLGMVIDVSHLSESCFWDLLEYTDGPLIASHSNVRALCDHPRNLDDEQLRAIAARGGVVGVNFYPTFLRSDDPTLASVDDLVAHVVGLSERMGVEHVGIGSDFDGIETVPHGLEHPGKFGALATALAAAGIDAQAIDGVFYGNFHRVFADVVG